MWAFIAGPNLLWQLALYAWAALCLHIIARRTYTPDAWLAWIPVFNLYLMCKVARRPGWWFLLFLVPLVNIVVFALIWMDMAEARRQSSWLGILMLVPVANLVVIGVLAFAEQPGRGRHAGGDQTWRRYW